MRTSHALFICLVVLASALAGCSFFDGGDSPDAGGPTMQGIGAPCETELSCRSGLVCTDGTCQPSGTRLEGATCELTADCADGLYCSGERTCTPEGPEAEGGACSTTANCNAGLVCTVEGFFGRCRPAGEGDLFSSCASETDCMAGLTCGGEPGQPTACLSPPAMPGVTLPPSIPLWPGAVCGEDTGAVRAYFRVPRGEPQDGDFYRLPYPNDVRRTASGLDLSGHASPGTVLDIDVIDRYLRASEEDLDGFSTNPVVYFRFSRSYDWDSLGGQIKLVDIDPDSPGFGNELGLGWLTTAGPLSKYICEDWLAVRPGHGAPLAPGTTYAVVLSNGIRPAPAEGSSFARDEDFDAVLGDSRPTGDALGAAWDAYQPLRDWLATTDLVDPAAVLNAAVFTTQDLQTPVGGLRQAVRAGAVPAAADLVACDDGVTSPCDDGTEARACAAADGSYVEIHGRLSMLDFQQGAAPFETPEDGGGVRYGGGGVATSTGTRDVCFALTVPTSTPPAEGWPLMVYLHGTGGSFRGAVQNGLAGELSGGANPAATLAIDLPQHGERKGGSSLSSEVLFYNFANPRAARGNVLQGAADLFSLAYFAEEGGIDAGSSPTGAAIAFDPSRITVFAHSQGATHASLALPFESAFTAAVLSGNGGDLTQSLLNKSSPVNIAAVLPFALLDANRDGRLSGGDFHPALALFQAYFDAADPVNFGRYLHRSPLPGWPGTHVFMTYGTGDSYSPEKTMEAYARAARLTLVEPQIVDIGIPTAPAPVSENVMVGDTPFTMGLRQYEPNAGDDGHFVSTRTTGGRADALLFLRQAFAGDVPRIGG